MDDVSHVYVLGGRFACLILQNDWWLGHIAISPKPGFLLRFRRRVFVNNCQSVATKTFEIDWFQVMSGGHESRCH
jgi:hypothetical protein